MTRFAVEFSKVITLVDIKIKVEEVLFHFNENQRIYGCVRERVLDC
jgi:hypothetical protein